MPTGETIYDLLRVIVDRMGTGWRTEEEHRQYREMVTRLEEMAAFGTVAGMITTKTEVHNVERSDVRQLRQGVQRESPRLAAGDGPEHGGDRR